MGGLILGTGAWTAHKACHDAYGNLKPACIPKRNSSTEEDSANLDAIQNPDDINLLKSSYTAELRLGLNEEQAAAGLPPDPDDCDAHHIVPKREGRSWAKEYADSARNILESCNIDIDSTNNGVYLPSKKHKNANCTGSYHKTLHTAEYYKNRLSAFRG